LVESVVEHLRPRQLLLVLDNCEHVITACAHLAERLLGACPRLTILTTSREGLGLTGERLVAVPALDVPEAATAYSPDTRLELDAADAAALAGMCRALDGLPLAIELAAAQTRSLSIQQLAARLLRESPLALLTGGSRTALPRHQALRATIEWSYSLLTETEQALFRALAV